MAVAELLKFANYLRIPSAKLTIRHGEQGPKLSSKEFGNIEGLTTIYKLLSQTANKKLLGIGLEDEAIVSQWLEYRVTCLDKHNERIPHELLTEMDAYLSDKSFFVGHYLTLADIVLYHGLHSIMSILTFYEKQKYLHLSRWFKQVQHTDGVSSGYQIVTFQRNYLYNLSMTH